MAHPYRTGLDRKLCPYIARRLLCPRQTHCWYSHDLQRFEGVPYAESAPPCESWRKTGQCARGPACWYSHASQRHAQQPSRPALRTTLSDSSSGSSSTSIAVRALDPPELEEHSSQELLAFLRHYSDKAEVRCSCVG
jgi:Zinc finger C-x8-C-x5-C-x3-H type (and similar)